MRHDDQRNRLAGAILMTLLTVAAASAATVDRRLVEAARSQAQSAVRALLGQHVDVNARSNDGSTALLWAAHWNDVATASLLIRAGADPNTPIATGETPLMTCAASGGEDAVRLLILRGADVNAKEPTENQDALM